MGTLLEARGLVLPAPLWSALAVRDHPDAVERVHRDYAQEGVRLHTAATFRTLGAGPLALELTARAVAIARRACPHGQVLGSLAPIADCYRPDLSPPDAAAQHAERAAVLASTGIDRILVETFPHPGEAVAATRAAVATGLEVWTSLTPGYDNSLLTPAELAEGARRAADAGACIVLVNCLPAARALPWVRALAATGLAFGIQANAGAIEDGMTHGTPGAAERYVTLARRWQEHGAQLIGACCGTGPEHIRGLVSTFSERDETTIDA